MSFDARTCSLEALCASMLDRHRDTIGVQKPEFALRKLKVIVTAALDLSNRKGFQAMSLRDLSLASGVSMGGLYAYFDSKTTLLKMILTEVTSAVQRSLSDPPPAIAGDPRAHLLWLIDTHLRMTEAMLPWFTFAFMEAKNFPASERRMATDSEELTEAYLAGAIAAGIRSGAFRPDTSPLLPALIKPLLQDWYVKRPKYRRRHVAMQTYIDTVQAICLAACEAPGR
jgi:AcrR family transcriptional regulator